MNKLDTTSNGGFPLTLDDFRFEADAIRDAIKGLASAFGVDTFAGSFIISGCNQTGSIPNFIVNSGYICLKGEVCKVETHNLPALAVGQVLHWVVDETNDTNGAKTMENGATHQAYKLRKAKVISAVAPTDYLQYSSSPSYLLIDKINALRLSRSFVFQQWNNVGTSGQPPFLNSFTNNPGQGGDLQFTIDEFKNVIVRGAISGTNAIGGSNVIFNLPDGYRPPNNIIQIFWLYNNSQKDIGLVTIHTSGDVVINASLNGVAFANYFANFNIKFSTTD
jgi:hypothetical protein